jgi:hypothetical protein
MDPFRLIADRKIQEAMDEGAFENLAGAGKPLPLDEDACEDPALRMAHRLLRTNGFALWWIEEGKDIDTAISRLQARRAEGSVGAEEFKRVAAAINRRILSYNLQAPSLAHKLPMR